MRKNRRRLGRHGRGCSGSQQTGERGIPLRERLGRMLARRVGDVTSRAGKGLSDKDLSAAVADLSRLVMAAARLGKLEEAEARRKDERPIGVRIEECLSGLMDGYRAPADGGGSKAPDFGELGLRRAQTSASSVEPSSRRAAAGGGGDRG